MSIRDRWHRAGAQRTACTPAAARAHAAPPRKTSPAMSRLVIGSRAELIAALRAQEAPLAAGEAAARATAAAGAAAARAAFAAEDAPLRAELAAARAVFDAARAAFDAARGAIEAQVAAGQRVRDTQVAALDAVADAAAVKLAVQREPIAERRRAVAEELFLDALFLVAQFPGGQIAEAYKCCYAFDVRLCAGLCTATWSEEAFWSGLVRVAHPGRQKVTRLIYTAAHGDAARVSWLLARGAPRDAKDVNGYTALHWASNKGHTDAVRTLLAAGANVDAATLGRFTPLGEAACKGHVDVMRVLIAAGANVNAVADDGSRPLHDASENGHAAAATLLLDAGADVNALTNVGRSPRALATTPAMRALLAARGGAAACEGLRALFLAPRPARWLPSGAGRRLHSTQEARVAVTVCACACAAQPAAVGLRGYGGTVGLG